jgi:hypothetical protein
MKVNVNMYVHIFYLLTEKSDTTVMDSVIPADLKLKLAKRGYAYKCIKCENKFRG